MMMNLVVDCKFLRAYLKFLLCKNVFIFLHLNNYIYFEMFGIHIPELKVNYFLNKNYFVVDYKIMNISVVRSLAFIWSSLPMFASADSVLVFWDICRHTSYSWSIGLIICEAYDIWYNRYSQDCIIFVFICYIYIQKLIFLYNKKIKGPSENLHQLVDIIVKRSIKTMSYI